MYGKKEFLSYPFLYESKNIVEFELLTDELASLIGHSIAFSGDTELKKELIQVMELVYHANPCVRTKSSLEESEVLWLQSRYEDYVQKTKDRTTLFVLPTGCKLGSTLHLVRCKSKQLVRLMYQLTNEGIKVDETLFDFANVLANYAFACAMYANQLDGINELTFESRIYK